MTLTFCHLSRPWQNFFTRIEYNKYCHAWSSVNGHSPCTELMPCMINCHALTNVTGNAPNSGVFNSVIIIWMTMALHFKYYKKCLYGITSYQNDIRPCVRRYNTPQSPFVRRKYGSLNSSTFYIFVIMVSYSFVIPEWIFGCLPFSNGSYTPESLLNLNTHLDFPCVNIWCKNVTFVLSIPIWMFHFDLLY